MGNGVGSYAEVPVDEFGNTLYVPRSTLGDLLEAANAAPDAMERLDFPINPLPTGNRSTLQALGNQPATEVLLDNIKGYGAIAGAAVARRVKGLSKNLYVYSDHLKGGKVEQREQPEHRLSLTLMRPNKIFTMGNMLWLATWHLQQNGEAYWQKVSDGIGKTTELWPLPPQNVVPVASDTEGISGYLVRDGKGKEYALGLDEVIRFWTPDPLTLFSSMGVLGPQALEYDESRFLEDHLRSHFENDATPRVAIIGKAETAAVDPKAQRAFHQKWRSMYNARVGSAKSLPAFIPPGFDVKELSAHGTTTELVPLKESLREQLMAAYGVPGTIVGMDKNVNRATAEALEWIFDKNIITFYTESIAEGLTTSCAMDFDTRLRVGFREFVMPDKEHVLKQEEQDLKLGVKSVQQVLVGRNLDPKDAPWGELPIQPFGVGPYDGDFTIEDRVAILGAAGLSSDSSGQGSGSGRKQARASRLESMNRDDPADVDAARNRAVRFQSRYASPLGGAVLRVLRSQQADIIDRLRELPDEAFEVPQLDDTPRSVRNIQVRGAADDVLQKLFIPKTWRNVFSAAVVDHIKAPYEAAASGAAEQLTADDFVFSTLSQEAVNTQVFKLSGRVNATTLQHLKEATQEALSLGEGRQGLIKRLKPLFGRKRARVIANTEVVTAVQSGQVEGWKSTGQVRGKQWHISGNNSRDSHVAADGQEQPLDGKFVLGSGALASAPGDSSLDPADRVNCQCFLTPVIMGS